MQSSLLQPTMNTNDPNVCPMSSEESAGVRTSRSEPSQTMNQAEFSRSNCFSAHHFLPCQLKWINDDSPLKIIQKSRQIGISYADAFDSVCKASPLGARHDVWVSSRDEAQAKLYLEDCKYWAQLLDLIARDLGELVLDPKKNTSAH